VQIPFVGSAYKSRSLPLSAQRAVNLYLQTDEGKGGKTPVALIGTPGLKPWAAPALPSGATGGVRALLPLATGVLLAVVGAYVLRMNASGQVTATAGPMGTSVGPVAVEENGTSAVMVDGNARYTVNLSTWSFATISAPAADRVAFIDGYFVCNRPNSQQFDISGLFTTTFDALDFAAAEGSPDGLVSLIADHRELWLFGAVSTEVWTNTGNVDFPFERLPGAFIQTGCAAPASPARVDNSVFWVGSDRDGQGIVWRADGYRPQRISTHAIEREIQSYRTFADAIGMSYQQDGHTFYLLTFPAADRTWCYDAATGEWHERAWFDDLNQQRRHRANCIGSFAGNVLVGDWQTSSIYAFDLETYTDAGRPIRRIRTAQPISGSDYQQATHWSLQVDMESGVGDPESSL
jgi:hypothetical protein